MDDAPPKHRPCSPCFVIFTVIKWQNDWDSSSEMAMEQFGKHQKGSTVQNIFPVISSHRPLNFLPVET